MEAISSCRESDAKDPAEDLLGPVMGSIQQAMDFEDTELGRKMIAKAPTVSEKMVQDAAESDFGDWELIGETPTTPNISEGSPYENVSEVERTIEVSFNETGEEQDQQGEQIFNFEQFPTPL